MISIFGEVFEIFSKDRTTNGLSRNVILFQAT